MTPDFEAFLTLVDKMRDAQIAFFKAKGNRDMELYESKRLEREVDLMRKALRKPEEKSLFGGA